MANVQILKVGRALENGARGSRGGAPSKDSLWGVAVIGAQLVKFFGRTNGILRYKVEPMKAKDDVLAMFQSKLTKPFKTTGGDPVTYTDITKTYDTVHPGLATYLGSDFYKAGGRVNRRSTQTSGAKVTGKTAAKKAPAKKAATTKIVAKTTTAPKAAPAATTETPTGLSMSKDAIRKREKRAAAKAAAAAAATTPVVETPAETPAVAAA